MLTRGTRLGYLPQEAAEKFDGTVLDRALEAHRAVLDMREELDALHQRLAGIAPDDPELEPLLERTGELQHHLDMHDEHSMVPEARRVLSGLGFSTRDQDRPISEFSGGWRMRATLAALLLTDPTLLFLDEPTNHLDLPAMEWLEEYLESFRGGLVVVSHDRVFLDRIADTVRELDRGTMTEYAMSFTHYLLEREARRDRVEAQNEQITKRVAELQRFVERFGAKNTKATQAQSKRKMIERLAAQRIVLPRKPKSIRFSFPAPPHSGRTLRAHARAPSFGYDATRDIFADANLDLDKGDKIAIVGANGAGKTTLLRMIAGQLAPRAGADGGPGAHEDGVLRAARRRGARRQADHARVARGRRVERLAAAPARPAGQLPVRGRRRVQARARAVGRRAAARRAGAHPADAGEPAAARRADASPRPGGQGRARERARGLSRRGRRGDARSLAHGQPGQPHHRGRRRQGAPLPGRLRRLRGGARGAGRRRARARRGEVVAAAEGPRPGREGRRPGEDAGGGNDRRAAAEQKKKDKETARLEQEIETREKDLKEVEALLADPDVYADGARSKDLVKRYEVLRAEIDALWGKLGAL